MKQNRTVILVVLDGWGIGQKNYTNPIHVTQPQTINFIKSNFPGGSLQASGIAVGLPWGEEGNSEVGHLNMGAGKILYQNYPKISLSIRNESFFKNPTLTQVFSHAKENNSAVNFVGLIEEGNVHSSMEHIEALLKLSDVQKFPKEKLRFHFISDGRDSSQHASVELLKQFPAPELIASVGGRYYAMDRDSHWDRTRDYYSMLVGAGKTVPSAVEYINSFHRDNLSDEYITPALIGSARPIGDNDSVFFFNFREDRMRQLVRAFIDPDFKRFAVKQFSNLFVSSMVRYSDEFPIQVAFPPETIEAPLGKVLADNGKTQWRIAETEKYAHITYFFNGLKEDAFTNEYRVLIPSKLSFKYDEHPEMMSKEITTRTVEALRENIYDFILVNYANADIVAHTGNFEATCQAIKIIDEYLGQLVQVTLETNAIMLITADHGNAERLINPQTGEAETKHDSSPVPFYLVAKEFQKEKGLAEAEESEKFPLGVLSDVAPTILEIMGLEKPEEMTGQSVLKTLIEPY